MLWYSVGVRINAQAELYCSGPVFFSGRSVFLRLVARLPRQARIAVRSPMLFVWRVGR